MIRVSIVILLLVSGCASMFDVEANGIRVYRTKDVCEVDIVAGTETGAGVYESKKERVTVQPDCTVEVHYGEEVGQKDET